MNRPARVVLVVVVALVCLIASFGIARALARDTSPPVDPIDLDEVVEPPGTTAAPTVPGTAEVVPVPALPPTSAPPAPPNPAPPAPPTPPPHPAPAPPPPSDDDNNGGGDDNDNGDAVDDE